MLKGEGNKGNKGAISEVRTAQDFLNRLSPVDAITVNAIVGLIKDLSARAYSIEHPSFFAVYGIGGIANKPGEREDVDLLITTNAHWKYGYYSEKNHRKLTDPIVQSADPIAGLIRDAFEDEGYKVKLKGKIPSNYDQVGVKPKAMLRLTPDNDGSNRKPIDIVYVRTTYLENVETLADFEKIDVDENGKPLKRIVLFKSEAHEMPSGSYYPRVETVSPSDD
jgi:hypothetical protein